MPAFFFLLLSLSAPFSFSRVRHSSLLGSSIEKRGASTFFFLLFALAIEKKRERRGKGSILPPIIIFLRRLDLAS